MSSGSAPSSSCWPTRRYRRASPWLVSLAAAAVVLTAGCTPKAKKEFGESNQAFLDRYLAGDDTDLMRSAITQVANSGDARKPWAQERFSTTLASSPVPLIREAALFGVYRSGPESTPVLLDRLRSDPSEIVRTTSARYLSTLAKAGALGDAEYAQTRDLAVALITDKPPEGSRPAAQELKIVLIRLLGSVQERVAIDVLLGLLESENFALAQPARDSLMQLTGQTMGYRRADWEAWLNSADSPFANAGNLPPNARKKQMNVFQRVMAQYRWKEEFE